jgi:hypothetical protein
MNNKQLLIELNLASSVCTKAWSPEAMSGIPILFLLHGVRSIVTEVPTVNRWKCADARNSHDYRSLTERGMAPGVGLVHPDK